MSHLACGVCFIKQIKIEGGEGRGKEVRKWALISIHASIAFESHIRANRMMLV